MNYAMHAINGFLTGITTADFPGAACRWVEKAFKDNMVMIYTQGASGDQNPLWLRPGTNALASKTGVKITGYEMAREKIEAPLRDGTVPHGKLDPEVADNLERWIDALGLILGEEAIRVMTNIDKQDSDVRIWGAQKVITLPGRKRTNTGREGEPGTYEDGPPVNIRLGLLGIGNIALTSIDSEIYNIFAQHLKKASPMTNTVMVTISNGRTNSGYIIDDTAYGRNTFQVLGNRLKPGYAEQGIVDGLLDLIEGLDDWDRRCERKRPTHRSSSPPTPARLRRRARGQSRGAIGVVVDKRQLGAVERARPSVQNRRLPGKVIDVGRRGAQRHLALGLRVRSVAVASCVHERKHVESIRLRIHLAVGRDNRIDFVGAKRPVQPLLLEFLESVIFSSSGFPIEWMCSFKQLPISMGTWAETAGATGSHG